MLKGGTLGTDYGVTLGTDYGVTLGMDYGVYVFVVVMILKDGTKGTEGTDYS